MADTLKIEESVRQFFDAFGKLGPEEKVYFLAEIDKQMKKKDEKDRNLYLALIRSAREGLSYQETIDKMKRA